MLRLLISNFPWDTTRCCSAPSWEIPLLLICLLAVLTLLVSCDLCLFVMSYKQQPEWCLNTCSKLEHKYNKSASVLGSAEALKSGCGVLIFPFCQLAGLFCGGWWEERAACSHIIEHKSQLAELQQADADWWRGDGIILDDVQWWLKACHKFLSTCLFVGFAWLTQAHVNLNQVCM